MFAQNAGNRISEVLDFKISRGSMPPDPPNGAMHLRCIGTMHRSKISVDPRLGGKLVVLILKDIPGRL